MKVQGENFAGASLRGTNLVASVYEDCDFSGADLEGAVLSGMTFRRCKLVGAVLRGARANGAYFIDCDLTRADARSICLSAANLIGGVAPGACFDQADAPKLTTHRSDLSRSSWAGANLRRADLLDTCFAEAVLDEARIPYATVARADLQDASMRDMDVQNAFITSPRTTRVLGAPRDPWTNHGENDECLFDAWNAARAADPRFPALASSRARQDEDLLIIQIGHVRPDLDAILTTESWLFVLTTKWFRKVALHAVIARRVQPNRMIYAVVPEPMDAHPLEGALDVFSRFAREEGFTVEEEDVLGYAQLALHLTGTRTTREGASVSRAGDSWIVTMNGWQQADPRVQIRVERDGTVTR